MRHNVYNKIMSYFEHIFDNPFNIIYFFATAGVATLLLCVAIFAVVRKKHERKVSDVIAISVCITLTSLLLILILGFILLKSGIFAVSGNALQIIVGGGVKLTIANLGRLFSTFSFIVPCILLFASFIFGLAAIIVLYYKAPKKLVVLYTPPVISLEDEIITTETDKEENDAETILADAAVDIAVNIVNHSIGENTLNSSEKLFDEIAEPEIIEEVEAEIFDDRQLQSEEEDRERVKILNAQSEAENKIVDGEQVEIETDDEIIDGKHSGYDYANDFITEPMEAKSGDAQSILRNIDKKLMEQEKIPKINNVFDEISKLMEKQHSEKSSKVFEAELKVEKPKTDKDNEKPDFDKPNTIIKEPIKKPNSVEKQIEKKAAEISAKLNQTVKNEKDGGKDIGAAENEKKLVKETTAGNEKKSVKEKTVNDIDNVSLDNSRKEEKSEIKEVTVNSLPLTKRHIIMNRQNVVNMFSQYLEKKDENDKEKLTNSINTIILK